MECNIKLQFFNGWTTDRVRKENSAAPERGDASLWHTGHFPQLDLQNKNLWLKRCMPTLKDTKKTLQYLRELV